MTTLQLRALGRSNEGRQWKKLLGCDYWVQAETSGTPRPKTVGFCNLVRVAIAPVSKKLALKTETDCFVINRERNREMKTRQARHSACHIFPVLFIVFTLVAISSTPCCLYFPELQGFSHWDPL